MLRRTALTVKEVGRRLQQILVSLFEFVQRKSEAQPSISIDWLQSPR